MKKIGEIPQAALMVADDIPFYWNTLRKFLRQKQKDDSMNKKAWDSQEDDKVPVGTSDPVQETLDDYAKRLPPGKRALVLKNLGFRKNDGLRLPR